MRKLPAIILAALFVTLIAGSVVFAQMPDRGTISGSVTIQDSEDVLQNAMIKAYLVDGPQWPAAFAQSDEEGNYQLMVPYGEYYIQAHKMNYLPEWWQEAATREEAISVTVDADNDAEGINFTLTAISTDFGSIAGNVTDSETTNPIADAVVSLHKVGDWHFNRMVHTGEDGMYLFEELPAGLYELECGKEGYIPAEYPNQVEINGDDVAGIDFVLEPLVFGSIAGTVTESGTTNPIADAMVGLHKVGDWHFNRWVNTGENGSYLFDDLPVGSYELSCGKEGYIPAEYPDQVEVNGDDVAGIDFVLEPMVFGTISGTITDAATEEPVAGARITAFIPEVHHFVAETVSGEDGTYTLENILTGTYEIRCCKYGYNEQVYPELVAVNGDDIVNIDFALEPYVIGGIAGAITDGATEEPIEGAFVIAIGEGYPHHHRWAITNENGEYSLELLAGEYFLQVYAIGYVSYHAEDPIVVGDEIIEGVNIALIPVEFGSISGTVYNSDNEPIADAMVTLSMHFGPCRVRTYADENGNYTFDQVYPGNYRLMAFAQGFVPESYDSLVVVENGSDITGIDFYLEPFTPPYDGFISGIVTDETTGDPIAGAWVAAIELGGNHHWFRVRHTHTLEDGSYIFNYLPDSDFKVICFAENYIGEFYDNKTSWRDADIVTPDADGIDFALAAVEIGPRILSGRVLEQNLPVNGAVVLAMIGDEVAGITASDPDGYYFLNNLEPAEYTVLVIGPDESEGSIEASAILDDVYEADIVLSPTSIDDEIALPMATTLNQNYPNPFNATTNINFYLADGGDVELSVYDLLGRKVSTLVSSNLPSGSHVFNWNGLDNNGQQVSSGLYLYALKTANETLANRMMLLK